MDAILTINEYFALVMAQTKSPTFVVITGSVRNAIREFGQRMQMLLQFLQINHFVDWR